MYQTYPSKPIAISLRAILPIAAFLLVGGMAKAQNIPARPTVDTAQIISNITAFSHILFKRAAPDSLMAYCGFPFYLKDGDFEKTFTTRAAFHTFIKQGYAKDKTKAFRYTIDSVYKPKNCSDAHIKAKAYCCVDIRIHFPDMGEGSDGNLEVFTYFVSTEPPYNIVGAK
jgi:hypothetical protein